MDFSSSAAFRASSIGEMELLTHGSESSMGDLRSKLDGETAGMLSQRRWRSVGDIDPRVTEGVRMLGSGMEVHTCLDPVTEGTCTPPLDSSYDNTACFLDVHKL